MDNDLLKLLFKSKNKIESKSLISILNYLATVYCHSDLDIVSNLIHTFVLLLFDRTLHMHPFTDQEFQRQTFAMDFLLAKQ